MECQNKIGARQNNEGNDPRAACKEVSRDIFLILSNVPTGLDGATPMGWVTSTKNSTLPKAEEDKYLAWSLMVSVTPAGRRFVRTR